MESELIEHVIELYKKGLSIRKVAKIISIPPSAVYNTLKKNNISMTKRRYVIDEHFFDEIDTPFKAYFLGWLYADGNNYRGTVELKIVDYEIVELMRKYIYKEIERPIQKKLGKGRRKAAFCFRICNKHISNKLKLYGCEEAKTSLIRFPSWLKSSLISYFLRGYFEGDGWIYIYNRLRKNNKRTLQIQWGISSNFNFVSDIKNFLEPLLQIKLQIYPSKKNKGVGLTTTNLKYIEQIINFIYKDSLELILTRKYIKCQLAGQLIKDRNYRRYWLNAENKNVCSSKILLH